MTFRHPALKFIASGVSALAAGLSMTGASAQFEKSLQLSSPKSTPGWLHHGGPLNLDNPAVFDPKSMPGWNRHGGPLNPNNPGILDGESPPKFPVPGTRKEPTIGSKAAGGCIAGAANPTQPEPYPGCEAILWPNFGGLLLGQGEISLLKDSQAEKLVQASKNTKLQFDESVFAKSLKNAVGADARFTAVPSPFDQHRDHYTKGIRTAIFGGKPTNGILFSSVAFPAVGRLIRTADGNASFCTGSLIDERYFVTAAHCFCERSAGGHSLTAQDCLSRGLPSSKNTYVYIPAAGHFEISGEPILNPAYRAFDDPKLAPAGSTLADLAIVKLARPAAGVSPLALDGPSKAVSAFSAGFGLTSLREEHAKALRTKVGDYSAGLGTISLMAEKSCPPGYGDVLCAHYSDQGWKPEEYTTKVCPGDSGGPLIGLGDYGETMVLGVVSQRGKKSSQCDLAVGDYSMYTAIAPHREWIRSIVSKAATDKSGDATVCQESLVRLPSSGQFSFQVNVKTKRNNFMVSRASVDLDVAKISATGGEGLSCQNVAGLLNLLHCSLDRAGPINVTIAGSGLAAVSVCALSDDPK